VTFLVPVCPVVARLAKKGKVETANVGAAVEGLGTGNVKPGFGSALVFSFVTTPRESL